METRKFLFIGGPYDGEKKAMQVNDEGEPILKIVQLIEPMKRELTRENIRTAEYKTCQYRIEHFVGKREHFAYVHSSIFDPMEALIEGYAK